MVKKLTHEEFCSVAHRQAYHSEQEKLAIANLVEQQRRMRPKRSKALAVASRGEDFHPEFAELVDSTLPARAGASSVWRSPAPVGVTIAPIESIRIVSLAPVRNGLAPSESSAKSFQPRGTLDVEEAMRALSVAQLVMPSAVRRAEIVAVPRPLAFPSAGTAIDPYLDLPASPVPELDFDADPEDLPFVDLEALFRASRPAAELLMESYGAKRFAFSRLPDASSGTAAIVEFAVCEEFSVTPWKQVSLPPEVKLARGLSISISDPAQLHPTSPRDATPAIRSQGATVAIEARVQPLAERRNGNPAVAQFASFVWPASAGQPPERSLPAASSIQRVFARPRVHPPREPNLAPGDSIPIAIPGAEVPPASQFTRACLARINGEGLVAFPVGFAHAVAPPGVPEPGGLLPLLPKARVAGIRRSSLSVAPARFGVSNLVELVLDPVLAPGEPRSRDAAAMEKLGIFRPRLNLSMIPAYDSSSPFSALSQLSGGQFKLSWTSLRRRWQEAPNDLRWIALAVPLVIGLIWFAESPGRKDNAKSSVRSTLSSLAPNIGDLWKTSFSNDSFEGIRRGIQHRAAVELSDDFRQGLGEWSGKGDWARGWNYDTAGFIRPRQMALYTPTLGLEDYRFEFLGAIEKKALSWVFRAADLKNYYVSRLEVTKSGPLPTVELIRFAVIDGRPGPKKSIPLPFQGRMDAIYRVRVDVSGADFVTTVQGQIVDVFSDDRLPRGGVGFYTEGGEDARLRWVEVSHQYDFLGRLCAFLVPYDVSNSIVRSAP